MAETWFDVVQKAKTTTVLGRLSHKYYAVRKSLSAALLIPSKDCSGVEEATNHNFGMFLYS